MNQFDISFYKGKKPSLLPINSILNYHTEQENVQKKNSIKPLLIGY